MKKPLLVLATTAWLFAHPVFADPESSDDTPDDRPGAWTITSSTRLLDPRSHLLEMPPRVAHALIEGVTPPSSQNYCVVGNEKLIAANRVALFDTVHCTVHRNRKSGQTYYMSYSCGGHGSPMVNGRIDVTYDTNEHYTGKTIYASDEMSTIKFESTFEGKWVGETCPGH